MSDEIRSIYKKYTIKKKQRAGRMRLTGIAMIWIPSILTAVLVHIALAVILVLSATICAVEGMELIRRAGELEK